MQNPWKDLPRHPPFVLPIDKPVLGTFRYNDKNRPRFEILPAPFLGRPTTAEIYLLNLNPGFKQIDITTQRNDKDYVDQKQKSMEFKSRFPFFIIDPRFSGRPGYDWWRNGKLKELINLFSAKRVAEKFMCIQYFPYQSISHKEQKTIPSQEYSFYLVREAINREKMIIIMRHKKYWLQSVHELANYPVTILNNWRNPTISRGNMNTESYNQILSILQ